MTLTPSMMPPLGSPAPDFQLPNTHNQSISLKDFSEAPALLVAFISHHCPFTRHILPAFIEMVRVYKPRGLTVVAINANDPDQHAEDSPEQMAQAAEDLDLPFPFLIDADQTVAQAYQAACTPDFFLYDGDRNLSYRGRFDDSRPDNDEPVSGDQLEAAIQAALAGETPARPQKPSVGCNIKWKPGNEPAYFQEQERKRA